MRQDEHPADGSKITKSSWSDEMAFLVEVVVKQRVDRDALMQRVGFAALRVILRLIIHMRLASGDERK